jgi:hypothetical protein
LKLTIQNDTLELADVSQLYPAAMIRYADGTVTPISLEWFDNMANRDVELLHYAICIHYKEKEREPLFYRYDDREALEAEIVEISRQIGAQG